MIKVYSNYPTWPWDPTVREYECHYYDGDNHAYLLQLDGTHLRTKVGYLSLTKDNLKRPLVRSDGASVFMSGVDLRAALTKLPCVDDADQSIWVTRTPWSHYEGIGFRTNRIIPVAVESGGKITLVDFRDVVRDREYLRSVLETFDGVTWEEFAEKHGGAAREVVLEATLEVADLKKNSVPLWEQADVVPAKTDDLVLRLLGLL